MFKRITPQTIADWGERIYIRFLELTKRFTSTQIMALLAIIVGVLAGLGTCLFELLLYGNVLLVVTAVPTVENARLFDFQLLAPLRLRRVLCRFSRQQRHPLLTIDLQ